MLRQDGTSEVYFGSHFGHSMLVVLLEKTIDYLTRYLVTLTVVLVSRKEKCFW